MAAARVALMTLLPNRFAMMILLINLVFLSNPADHGRF